MRFLAELGPNLCFLATLSYRSGNPVDRTLSKIAPFDSSWPKTDTKIMFLGQLGEKLCCKIAKIGIWQCCQWKKLKKIFGQNEKSIFSTHVDDDLCIKNKSITLLVGPGELDPLLMSQNSENPHFWLFFHSLFKKIWKKIISQKTKKNVDSTHLVNYLCIKNKSLALLVWPGELNPLLMSQNSENPHFGCFFTKTQKKRFQ